MNNLLIGTSAGQGNFPQELRSAWVDDLAKRYPWDEFATLTFKLPQFDSSRALAMFNRWLTARYFEHAVNVRDVVRHSRPKLEKDGVRGKRDKVMVLDKTFDLTGVGRYVPVWKDALYVWYTGAFRERWRRKGNRPVFVVGIEQHKGGANHLHALIHHRTYRDGPKQLRRDDGWDLWKNKFGYGRMSLEPPASLDDVRGYVGKYLTKSGAELVYSDSFTAGQTSRPNKKPTRTQRPRALPGGGRSGRGGHPGSAFFLSQVDQATGDQARSRYDARKVRGPADDGLCPATGAPLSYGSLFAGV